MATAALRRAMTAFTRPPDPSDADLLRQFAASRSETAFAALVRRHGPLVRGAAIKPSSGNGNFFPRFFGTESDRPYSAQVETSGDTLGTLPEQPAW